MTYYQGTTSVHSRRYKMPSGMQPEQHICGICSLGVTNLKLHKIQAHSHPYYKCGLCAKCYENDVAVANKVRICFLSHSTFKNHLDKVHNQV